MLRAFFETRVRTFCARPIFGPHWRAATRATLRWVILRPHCVLHSCVRHYVSTYGPSGGVILWYPVFFTSFRKKLSKKSCKIQTYRKNTALRNLRAKMTWCRKTSAKSELICSTFLHRQNAAYELKNDEKWHKIVRTFAPHKPENWFFEKHYFLKTRVHIFCVHVLCTHFLCVLLS